MVIGALGLWTQPAPVHDVLYTGGMALATLVFILYIVYESATRL